MAAFEALFGATLSSNRADASTVPTAEALGACEAVALYFSAHWCPPCRAFTPKLAEAHAALRGAGKPFEIVFVSSDKEDSQFQEYFAEMPWLALPYADRAAKDALSAKFKVKGIPTLVILDKEGKVITKDGRAALSAETQEMIDSFPWKPPTLKEALGNSFVNKGGEEVTLESLAAAGKNIGLYFSAHWCPPCKAFTPKLVSTYNKLTEAGQPFELIFVSSDRSEDQFKEYYDSMPWLALPYSDRTRKSVISQHFGVNGIPQLIILSPDLKVINANARGAVESDKEGKEFPWAPKPVTEIEECEALNDNTSLILLMEEASDHWDELEANLTTIATDYRAAAADDEEFNFCVAKETGGIAGQIRKLLKLGAPGDKAEMVILDVPDGGSYAVYKGPVCESSIKAFLKDYKAGSVPKDKLR